MSDKPDARYLGLSSYPVLFEGAVCCFLSTESVYVCVHSCEEHMDMDIQMNLKEDKVQEKPSVHCLSSLWSGDTYFHLKLKMSSVLYKIRDLK